MTTEKSPEGFSVIIKDIKTGEIKFKKICKTLTEANQIAIHSRVNMGTESISVTPVELLIES